MRLWTIFSIFMSFDFTVRKPAGQCWSANESASWNPDRSDLVAIFSIHYDWWRSRNWFGCECTCNTFFKNDFKKTWASWRMLGQPWSWHVCPSRENVLCATFNPVSMNNRLGSQPLRSIAYCVAESVCDLQLIDLAFGDTLGERTHQHSMALYKLLENDLHRPLIKC